jgi:hypothetical protein
MTQIAFLGRSPLLRTLVVHQGWYFFPLLFLEGLVLHVDGIRRVLGRDRIDRRWFELSFLGARLGGLVALVFVVLPPGKAVAFLAVQVAAVRLLPGFLVRTEPPRDAASCPRGSCWTSCGARS